MLVDLNEVRRANLANAFKNRKWSGNVCESEVRINGSGGQLPVATIDAEDRLNFRGEQQAGAVSAVVQRLFAETIAGQREDAAFFIPQSQSEHSIGVTQRCFESESFDT